MSPTINDGDLVFVDVECRSIEAAGIYVLDVAGRLILKKAMILSSGTLIIRSDNIDEYPDEERYDLRPEQFPHSQKAFERMLTLPLYTRMTDADVERVIASVRKALGRA